MKTDKKLSPLHRSSGNMMLVDSKFEDISLEKFQRTLLKTQIHLQRLGVNIKAWNDPSLPHFQALGALGKKSMIKHAEIFESSLDESGMEFFHAEQRFLWKALSLFGFVPPMGLFEQLRPDRAIEIYDLEWHQLWRNIVTIELCSYTLEEVVCVPAFRRYSREPAMQSEVIEKVTKLLIGEKPEVHDPLLKRHILSETASEKMYKLDAKHELLSVLRNRSGKVVAWLVMSKAEVCEEKKPRKLAIV